MGTISEKISFDIIGIKNVKEIGTLLCRSNKEAIYKVQLA